MIHRTSTPEHFGTGVYLVASLLNHSCVPNCTVVFQGRQLAVVATKAIPAGDIPSVAFITYVNSLDDTMTRQDQLRCNPVLEGVKTSPVEDSIKGHTVVGRNVADPSPSSKGRVGIYLGETSRSLHE